MLRQNEIVPALIAAYPTLGFTTKQKKDRLGNSGNVSESVLIQCIKTQFNPDSILIHPPKWGPNKSSKFRCFELIIKEISYFIINCNYVNKGITYEATIADNLINKTSTGRRILKEVNVNPGEIYKIDLTGSANCSRPIYQKTTPNVGQAIADIIIDQHTDHPKFLSIKAGNGVTLYNGKNVLGFSVKENVVTFDVAAFNHGIHSELFNYLGINPYLVVEGLQNYLNKRNVIKQFDVEPSRYHYIERILRNAYGYGYYLVKESGDEVHVTDLTQEHTIENMIGEILSAKVVYPNYKTKSLTVKIKSKNFITDVIETYNITFRNASGALLPLSMRISKH